MERVVGWVLAFIFFDFVFAVLLYFVCALLGGPEAGERIMQLLLFYLPADTVKNLANAIDSGLRQ